MSFTFNLKDLILIAKLKGGYGLLTSWSHFNNHFFLDHILISSPLVFLSHHWHNFPFYNHMKDSWSEGPGYICMSKLKLCSFVAEDKQSEEPKRWRIVCL